MLRSEFSTTRIDIDALYTAAFQDPKREMRLLREEYVTYFAATPRILREDFCGTAANAMAWADHKDGNCIAIGVDIDRQSLEYAKTNTFASLSCDVRNRISLIHGDVLSAALPDADLITALNCSFCYFWERQQFKRYLERTFETLGEYGMLALEIYCGADAYNLGCDEIPIEGATAIWEQAKFDPITNRCLNFIHFRMDNGDLLEQAFEYDFRLWSPAECIDLIREVGFVEVKVINMHETQQQMELHVDASATLFILGFKNR